MPHEENIDWDTYVWDDEKGEMVPPEGSEEEKEEISDVKDCDGKPKQCSYDWSVGIGADLHVGNAGSGGSAAYGPTGVSLIGDLPFSGGGLDVGGGIEACLIISCPL